MTETEELPVYDISLLKGFLGVPGRPQETGDCAVGWGYKCPTEDCPEFKLRGTALAADESGPDCPQHGRPLEVIGELRLGRGSIGVYRVAD